MVGLGLGSSVISAIGTYLFTKSGDSVHKTARMGTQGTTNNVVQDQVEIESKEIPILLGIICGIKVIEFLYFMYNQHIDGIKRKYEKRQVQNMNSPA